VNKPKLVTRRNIKANITTIKEKDGSVNIILNK
jgi:hypothetical protein